MIFFCSFFSYDLFYLRTALDFTTDREYREHKNGNNPCDESSDLEVWEGDDEELGNLKVDNKDLEDSRGWPVDEMFDANNALGVKSTFDGDLSQYTT